MINRKALFLSFNLINRLFKTEARLTPKGNLLYPYLFTILAENACYTIPASKCRNSANLLLLFNSKS